MPAGRDQRQEPSLDQLAERFRTVGEFFVSIGEPKQAGRVVEALRADEPTAFRELLDQFPDFPGKCLTLCRAVKTLVNEDEYVKQRLCRLRWDLTPQERLLAARIYWKHFGTEPTVVEPPSGPGPSEVTPVIDEWLWPSAYRDELEANDLVVCMDMDVPAPPIVGPPSWGCLDLCSGP